jgi:ribosome-associated protein
LADLHYFITLTDAPKTTRPIRNYNPVPERIKIDTPMNTHKPTQIEITKEPIRLSQFLKLANVVQDGLEAKIRITEGEVLVNGALEIRRGRKLFYKDTVQIDDTVFQVTETKK